MSHGLRGTSAWRHDSAPSAPNYYELEDAKTASEESMVRQDSGGAPPTPDATRGPGVKSLATDLESAQGSEPTAPVAAPKTPGPGPPVETPKSATKSVTPSKPKKKSLLKTLASPIQALKKKITPKKKKASEPRSPFSPCSDITTDRGSPRNELSVEDMKDSLANHPDAALLAPTSPRKFPEWLAKLKCCTGDASGERGSQ